MKYIKYSKIGTRTRVNDNVAENKTRFRDFDLLFRSYGVRENVQLLPRPI